MTRILYRVTLDDGGEVFAVFIDDKASGLDPDIMGMYARVGQHCQCSKEYVIRQTREASPAEYADLHNELVNLVGYDDLHIMEGEGLS